MQFQSDCWHSCHDAFLSIARFSENAGASRHLSVHKRLPEHAGCFVFVGLAVCLLIRWPRKCAGGVPNRILQHAM